MSLQKIPLINSAIIEWFILNKSYNIVLAKDLMPWFIQKGIWDNDVKGGLPIRKILRKLDDNKQLHLIPFVKPERKKKNTNWFFIRNESIIDKTKLIEVETLPVIKKGRANSDEAYVIDLCDIILKRKATRQATFPFLIGDPNKNGICRKLPVDAYYSDLSLAIEYYERQHTEVVAFFDNRQTHSGMKRGEQRKLYDERRIKILSENYIKLIVISYSDFEFDRNKKIVRNLDRDSLVILKFLKLKTQSINNIDDVLRIY